MCRSTPRLAETPGDGTRAHRLAGTTVNDNMADPNCIRGRHFATAPPASVDVGVRSRAATVVKMVMGARSRPSA